MTPTIANKGRIKLMTKFEFIALCSELTLDPDLVLDDDNVQAMLISREDQELKEYLESEY